MPKLNTAADVLLMMQQHPKFGSYFGDITVNPATPFCLMLPGGASIVSSGDGSWCVVAADGKSVVHCPDELLTEAAWRVMGWKLATDGMTQQQIDNANENLRNGLSI